MPPFARSYNLSLTIRSGYVDARPEIAKFIERVGRRKLILPIYEELVKTQQVLNMKHLGWESLKGTARMPSCPSAGALPQA